MLASEVAPYAKTGGLADVAGALPKFLSGRGLGVRVILPFYRQIQENSSALVKVLDAYPLDWDGKREFFSVWEDAANPFSVWFIEKNEFFDRSGLYGTPAGDYPDNGERFAFFSRAALETLKALGFAPDVIHVHDWQSAIALAYLKFSFGDDVFFKNTRSLFTIHNLAYQGLFDPAILRTIGLPDDLFTTEGLEFYGKVNFLKAGILYATAINTVSHKYSLEIQTPEYGCGLDGLLRAKSHILAGILNGVDYTAWNPAADAVIAANYTAADLSGKALCKKDLLDVFELPSSRKDVPVIGLVSRLAGQKGLDILGDALGEGLFTVGVKLAVLGTGEEKIQAALTSAKERYPSFLGLKIAFDDRIAHKIMAGSDMFLIPSRYEPCGLTQMYALKYGSIPVVRATGGLDDSIQEFDRGEGTGNGFKFEDYSAKALISAVQKAVQVYKQKSLWAKIMQNAMAADFSWDRSAREYEVLYKQLPRI